MKSIIKIQELFEEMFNSNVFDNNHLWNNFLEYEFSNNELKDLEEIKNKAQFNLSIIPEDKLSIVFRGYFHKYGFFDFQFDNIEDGWLYPTVEMFYNEDLDLGYIYTVNNEIFPFRGFSTGEKIYENKIGR